MRRSLFALVVVVLAAVVVYVFQSGSAPIDLDGSTSASSLVDPVETPAEAAPVEMPSGLRESVVVPREKGEPPPEYVAALGGIMGRVVDSARSPMPDFPVELLGAPLETLVPIQDSWLEKPDFDLGLDRRSVRTDAAGRFRIDRVEPMAYHLFRLGAGTNREKWDLCAGQPESGQFLDVGDLVLDEFAIVTGRVLDAEGKPKPGARVRASQLPSEFFKFGGDRLVRGSAVAFKVPGEDDWRVFDLPPVLFRILDMLPYRTTETAEDGTFRLEGVPLGMVSVVADAPSFLPALRGPVNTGGGGEKAIGDLRIHPGETLVGRVIDGSDLPVHHARVYAGPVLPFFPVALLTPLQETGADGIFSGDGFSEDAHVVAARRREAVTFTVAEDVAPGIDEPELRVDETTTLTVHVKDSAGEVVRGPRIFVQPNNEMSDATFLQPPLDTASRTSFAEDGSIDVSGLSRTKFNVFAKKEGFALGRSEVDLEKGPASVEIVLDPERVGSVRVIAKATGKPLEHAMVAALDREGDGPDAAPIPVAPIAMARTDENGLAVLKGLDEGPQFVRAMHPAYASIDGELIAGDAVLTLELPQGGTLKGHIRRNGEPITESHVVVAFTEMEEFRVFPRLTLARAGDGAFEFSRLPEGEYFVQAGKKFEDLVMSMFGGPTSTMGMGDPFSLGMLSSMSFGRGATVRVEADSDPDEPVDSESGESSTVVVGGVDVGAEAPRGDDATNLAAPPPDVDPGYRAVVKEGQVTNLEIDLARMPGDFEKARLLGIVYVNGAPHGDLLVHASHHGGGANKTERTLANGRFDLGEVPAGELAVRVVLGKGEQLSYLLATNVTLAANEVRSLDLRVEAGRIEGSVRAASDRRPLSEARVRLLPLDERDQTDYEGCFLVEATGTDGSFHFDVVPEGNYKIEVQRSGFSAAATEKLRVPSRGFGPRCDLALIETVSVKGRVELPAGVAPPEALFVHFPSKAEIDFSGFVFVDPKSGEFTIESVAPGEYEVNVFGTDAMLSPVKVNVPVSGMNSCILRPEVRVVVPTAAPPVPAKDGG